MILQFLNFFTPDSKQHLLDLTLYLTQDLKVPVTGTDAIGTTALYSAISCKPFAATDYAQLLFNAGGSVNAKTRFGGNVGSEIAQADVHGDTSKNVAMMKWFVEHGGDVDAKDNDGMNVKTMVEMMRKRVPRMAEVVKAGRGERKEGMCARCGRVEGGLKACMKCKKVRYCGQECQRVDWKAHKKSCGVVA